MSSPGSIRSFLEPVDKEYGLPIADGIEMLAELFDGRSRLVIYCFLLGTNFTAEDPACSSTADSFDGVLVQLDARGVMLISVSRAPFERLLDYRGGGWAGV
jgi:predicted dithiol-disulfide oxidoreductase (DUF899 family)